MTNRRLGPPLRQSRAQAGSEDLRAERTKQLERVLDQEARTTREQNKTLFLDTLTFSRRVSVSLLFGVCVGFCHGGFVSEHKRRRRPTNLPIKEIKMYFNFFASNSSAGDQLGEEFFLLVRGVALRSTDPFRPKGLAILPCWSPREDVCILCTIYYFQSLFKYSLHFLLRGTL